MKKILSVVLALVLVCGLAVTAMAANLDVSVEPGVVAAGDTVIVTLTLDETVPVEAGSTVVQGQLYYDGTVLSFVEGTPGEGYEYLDILKHAKMDRINLNYLSMSNPQVPVALPAGTIAVLTFTALEATTLAELEFSANLVAQDLHGVDTQAKVTAEATVTFCPDHNVVETTVESTCQEPGSVTKTCETCGYNETVELDILPHTVEHVDAVEPGCENEGNVEYWYCTVCGTAWLDADCTQVTNLMSVKLGIKHNIEHVEAVEPGCDYDGNIEYWYCTICGAAWLDEYQHLNTNLLAVVLPYTGHTVEHVEAVEPTCFEEGNVEYWYCTVCGAAWLDEDCTLVTNLLSVKLPVSHKIEHVEANECTCWEDGNIEYWYCTECGYAWLDEYLHQNTNLLSVVLPYTGHTIEHVAAKAPTCTVNGNVEYWYCTCCGYAWVDEDCTMVSNLLSVVLPATGHVDENKDDYCDVCSNPTTGDFTVVVAAAAAVISLTGVVALPVAKKKFF